MAYQKITNMLETIQSFLDHAEKSIDFANSDDVDYDKPAESLPKLAAFIKQNGYDGLQGSTLATLLELNFNEDDPGAQDYELEDISELYDLLRVMYPCDLDIWSESAQFEYYQMDDKEKAVTIVKETMEMLSEKTGELNELLAEIGKEVDGILGEEEK